METNSRSEARVRSFNRKNGPAEVGEPVAVYSKIRENGAAIILSDACVINAYKTKKPADPKNIQV